MSEYANIPINDIIPNPNNPRKNFNEESLKELAQSIQEHGIIQPLVVNYDGFDVAGKISYRLICGERRYRAARMLGLESVPCVFRETDVDEPAMEALKMLVENLQREDLDPIEEAQAYQLVLTRDEYTQEEIAQQVGKSQGHIANRIRLLELPDTVRENISRGIISASHGKVLASHKNLPAPIMEKAAEIIASDNVPVAKADNMVLRLVAEKGLPLFDNYRKKPEFKSGKGSACYECQHRAMGKDMYISGDNEQPFCLNHECWEAKQAEAQQEAQRADDEQNLVDISKLNYNQYEYWNKGSDSYDQSECRDCEHRKKAKGRGSQYFCFDPACMRKKKTVKTKADNKQKNNIFEAELGQIAEMVRGRIDQSVIAVERDSEVTVKIDRNTLIYIAAQVLANVDTWNDRKVNRYQYLKNKFGWESDTVKGGAYSLLHHGWDSFHRLLETLDELQLLELIFEWPAVARGLKGAEGWLLQQVPQSISESKQEQGQDLVHLLVGRRIKTHYDTGGEVTNVVGPRDDGFYSVNYKNPHNGRPCYINSITFKDGVILCEGIPLTIPMTPSREEAQKNLDAWAEKNGLQLVEEGDSECKSA